MKKLTWIALAASVAAQWQLLVLHKGHSSLGFYTREGKLLGTAGVGQHPHEMVFSAEGRYAYTTDNGTMRIEQEGTGGNTVSIVDLKERKKVGEINLGDYRRPHGIDIMRSNGHLMVSTELPDQLLELDPVAKKVVRKWDVQGTTPHMVTLSRDEKYAFTSNSRSANISAIELATGKVKLIPVGPRPEGSALSTDGKRLYVTIRDGAELAVIDVAKLAVEKMVKVGEHPVRIAVTPDGKHAVYGLMDEQAVEWIDTATGKVAGRVSVKAELGQIVSLHVSHDGKTAFAANENFDTVYIVSLAEKKLVRQFKTPKGYAPDPVAEQP
jgi:YVTN family beta-propeller protein